MSRKGCIFAVLLLSVHAMAQSNPVYQAPTANQSIVQPPSPSAPTTFSTNNEAGIVYAVPSYNWTQSPSLPPNIVGTSVVTVTLNTCPAGILVLTSAQPFTRIWLAGTGTPEAVLVTATTCPLQGGGTGTVTFTAAFSHAQGYTLSSASQGIQEAINVANTVSTNFPNQLGKVIIPPGEYTAKARISILGHKQYIDANGAVLTCTMPDTCVFVGDIGGGNNANATFDVTIDGLAFRAGFAGRFPAIEDDGQHTTLRSIGTRSSLNSGTFFSIIQIDNDQSAVIEKLDPSLARDWAHCATDWCSVAIYGPGPFGTNAGVLWVKDSNISAQCAFNGIDNQDANALRVSDSVVQAYPQFGIRARGSNNNVAAMLDNVHLEVGGCTNPLSVGIAGFISEGFFSVLHGTGSAGLLPQFVTGGSGPLYVYYVVAKSTATTPPPTTTFSAPYLAGYSFQNAGFPINVKWPQVGTQVPGTNTIAYDLLRQAVTDLGATTAAPYGTGNFAVASGISQSGHCSNMVCSFQDTGSATTSYPVVTPSTFAPALTFWPGSVVLTEAADSVTNNGGEPRLYTDMAGQTGIAVGGYVNSYGANAPTVFAQQCSVPSAWSSIWISCPAGDSVSNNYPQVGALLLQAGPVSSDEPGGYKGRINLMAPHGTMPATHLITLGDSNPAKTLATPSHRPLLTVNGVTDTSDTWIGLDNFDANVNQFQLAFGAPVSISSYIHAVGNPATDTPLETLTSSAKTFNVPITANQSITANQPITANAQIMSTVGTGTAPFSVMSRTPVGNLTSQFAQGLSLTGATGSIGGSQLNAGQCANGTATINGTDTSMTAIASPSSSPFDSSGHGLAIWAYVSATNTVTVEVCAIVTTTPKSITYNVRVSK